MQERQDLVVVERTGSNPDPVDRGDLEVGKRIDLKTGPNSMMEAAPRKLIVNHVVDPPEDKSRDNLAIELSIASQEVPQ